MSHELIASVLVVLIVLASLAAIPHTLYLYRDALRTQRAVEQLDEPNGRRVVADSHVRASRMRLIVATITTVKAATIVYVIANATLLTWPVLGFLVLFLTAKALLAVDTWQGARDRRTILHAAQRRPG